ncbi:hypothetical protein [Streptomyces sp. NPDC050548]|uniref:hypothetical protein n=1 Tax=Streptomyces sp. NPDC050548 TaxID=3365629 RepID=UPI003796A478
MSTARSERRSTASVFFSKLPEAQRGSESRMSEGRHPPQGRAAPHAQDAGHLDPAWDPVDILVFVNQIAMAWSGRLDLVDAAADQARDPSPAARRAAVVTAVQRLFPVGASGGSGTQVLSAALSSVVHR